MYRFTECSKTLSWHKVTRENNILSTDHIKLQFKKNAAPSKLAHSFSIILKIDQGSQNRISGMRDRSNNLYSSITSQPLPLINIALICEFGDKDIL